MLSWRCWRWLGRASVRSSRTLGNALDLLQVGPGGLDEEGVGNGFVRRFNTAGVRDLTFGINNGALNSPWGIVQAPATFGIFGSALLIGNFGEGNPSIHAYNPTTGAFLGTLQDESGNGIVIDELWALTFGNDGQGGDADTMYFSAGIGEEEHGLFGSLNPTTASATSLIQLSSDDLSINEGAGHIDVTVTRAGDVSGTATINYATFDQSQPDHASQKSDYEIAVGKLSFAAGETSKTFRILLVNDLFELTSFDSGVMDIKRLPVALDEVERAAVVELADSTEVPAEKLVTPSAVREDSLAVGMSDYLITQLEATPNIDVRLRTRVVDGHGEARLEALTLEDVRTGQREQVKATAVFVLIGAEPRTDWLRGVLQLDDHGFILTGRDLPRPAWPLQRAPLPFETSLPGVFAAGDVRYGSVKRVAGAAGEGAVAVGSVHQYLQELSQQGTGARDG